jgi:RNA polymerase sigma factor (sigma-70 family)
MKCATATRDELKTTKFMPSQPTARYCKPLRYAYDDLCDHELVQACQLGDEHAFNSLLRRHERSMRSFLFKLAPDMRHEHDDMLQRIYIRIWKSIGSLKNPKAFKAWLNRLMTNQFYDDLRKHRQHSTVSLDEPVFFEDGEEHPSRDIADTSMLPDQRVESNEVMHEIGVAINALSVNFKNVLVLRELHGLQYDEIATLTQMEVGTVKSRLARARRKVQIHMNRLQCA